MNVFINKYYSVLFLVFLAATVGLSFYLGYEQGSNTGKTVQKQIVFSCPNTVLDKQKIISPSAPINSANLSATAYSEAEGSIEEESADGAPVQQGAFMGSKNGTKYYTPGCPGTKRIKPENYVWFQSAEDATLQGYSKGSC